MPCHPVKDIVSGEGFAYLGRRLRLLVVDELETPIEHAGAWLRLRRPRTRAAGAAAIIDWYTEQGRAWLPKRAAQWAPRLALDVPVIDVRDLGRRWGTRTAGNEVHIHWAAMQLSPELIDVIIVHELVHLLHPYHDVAFKQRVSAALDDRRTREAQLIEAERAAWLGSVQGGSADINGHGLPGSG